MAKILVIEDEEFILDPLGEMLRLAHYEVLAARTGKAGLPLAGANHPDVVLCDIALPGMDGYAVLQKLRADRATRHIPVIFLTGQTSPRRCRPAGTSG